MDQKGISLTNKREVVERDPEQLSEKMLEELIDIVQKVEQREEVDHQSKVTGWFHRVPFAGVRYYSYE